MSSTMIQLGIDQFDAERRIALAFEIWESLGESRPKNLLTDEQKKIIARRDREMDDNPEIAISWDEIESSWGQLN